VDTSFKPTAIQYLYRREPLGVYYARLYAGGRNKWISLRTKVFAVAKGELAKRLQSHYAVQGAEAATRKGRATMGDLSAIYLQQVELNHIKPSAKEYRRKTVAYLLRSWPDLSERVPNRITETECQEWAARYRKRFSATLYNNTVDSLRHIFDVATKRGLISRNPALEVPKVKVRQKKLELPSSEQFKELVEAIRSSGSATSQGNGDLVEFMAYSGCRVSEAASVRWSDIDHGRSRIYIAPGKTSTARYIPLLEPMKDLLGFRKFPDGSEPNTGTNAVASSLCPNARRR
jgi:integrase